MGGITKHAQIKGRTLAEAFRKLQEEDEREMGCDPYSGGWNNAPGIREVSEKEFNKRADDLSKHEPVMACCIKKPVGNNMKIKTSVENFPAKGTRKWETRYVVEDHHGRYIVNEAKQGEAIKKARAYVEKNPSVTVTVEIIKQLSESAKVAKISYKKSSKEADGVWKIQGVLSY